MKPCNSPVKIVNELWDHAAALVDPPQLAIVIVSEAPSEENPSGLCAFRHNCFAGLPALIASLRQFADQLERGEARDMLTVVKP